MDSTRVRIMPRAPVIRHTESCILNTMTMIRATASQIPANMAFSGRSWIRVQRGGEQQAALGVQQLQALPGAVQQDGVAHPEGKEPSSAR